MVRVGVIGGAGFIGSHITQRFLALGDAVRVSTTDASRQDKFAHLFELPGADHLEIVQADVRQRADLRAFVRDCEIVVHAGTPFQLNVDDPRRDLLTPTLDGTRNVLEALLESSTIRKAIILASVAAYNTNFPLPARGRAFDHVYSDTDEPAFDGTSHPYAHAKYHTDQFVRQFIETHKDLPFEIVSLMPVFVAGTALSARPDSTSAGLQQLVQQRLAPDPFIEMFYAQDVEFAIVDVEDVADAVVAAATRPGLHGCRYLLAGESWRISDMSRMLNEESTVHGPRTRYDSSTAQRDLGVEFRRASEPLTRFARRRRE